MTNGVMDQSEEKAFEVEHPELSTEAALIIWVIASYPDQAEPIEDPKPH